jgi:hypothetical protein
VELVTPLARFTLAGAAFEPISAVSDVLDLSAMLTVVAPSLLSSWMIRVDDPEGGWVGRVRSH